MKIVKVKNYPIYEIWGDTRKLWRLTEKWIADELLKQAINSGKYTNVYFKTINSTQYACIEED